MSERNRFTLGGASILCAGGGLFIVLFCFISLAIKNAHVPVPTWFLKMEGIMIQPSGLSPYLALAGLCLGIVSIIDKKEKRLAAIFGIAISLFTLLGVAALFYFGSQVQHGNM